MNGVCIIDFSDLVWTVILIVRQLNVNVICEYVIPF